MWNSVGQCGIPVALLCLTVLVQYCQGAERVEVRSLLHQALHRRHARSEPLTSYRFKRHADAIPMTELDDVLELEREANLEVVQQTMSVQGTQVLKLQEKYKGRIIPDAVVTLETDQSGRHVMDAAGSVYRDIDLDFEQSSQLDAEEAIALCQQYNQDDDTPPDSISHVKVDEEVLFDYNGDAYPAYLVQYLVSPVNENQRRPTCLIDARNSSVIVSWDDIDTCSDCKATGTGGNLKIGKIHYGDLLKCLNLRRENGTCYLENKYVRVINNNFTRNVSDDEGDSHAVVGSYNCVEIDDYVNGGYSPLLDALFYGTVVGRMFEDWYNMSPLGEVITIRVHYGVDYSNAFWNGFECSFGDGDGYRLHPMVGLDIVGHEIAHGITERNSNLYYYQQWGGINEAFSDMTGETVENYLKGNDWLVGFDIAAGDNPPLRLFEAPEDDGRSISHADDYTEFLDPHLGSGVYNHAFYTLVHEYGLTIKEVYHVFLHANRMYWHHMSNYVHAACDVMKSAYDLGQDGSKFREAFKEVGIEVCDVEDHVLGLKNKKVYKNITVSRAISPTFVFAVPGEFADSMTVKATSSSGDVYLILSDKKWGSMEKNVQVYGEGLHSVLYDLPENITMYISITLTTDSAVPLKDVHLKAVYNCFVNISDDYNSYREFILYRHWLENCVAEEEDEDEDESDDGDKSDEDEESEDEDEEEEKEEEGGEGEEEGEEGENGDEEGKLSNKTLSLKGHVFNFFHSFVIMVFPKSK